MFTQKQLKVLNAGYVAGAACPPLLIQADREQRQPTGVATNPLTAAEAAKGPWKASAKEMEELHKGS